MRRVILVAVMLTVLTYGQNTINDSLKLAFLDDIMSYHEKITRLGQDFHDISHTVIGDRGNDYTITTELIRINSASYSHYWHISDLIFVYLQIQNKSDKQAVREVMNLSKEGIVNRLEVLNSEINYNLARCRNTYLITKGDQMKATLAELAKKLKDFEF